VTHDQHTGTSPSNPSDSLDAMTAAPDHHWILFENDHVRVLDTRLGPGDTTPVHTHSWPSVLYVLRWSDIVRCDPKGNVLLDTRTAETRPEEGATLWSGPLPPHSATNVGTEELHAIAIELKTQSAAK
jgi:quercetin dioxygenase-like cupin family protein